MKSSHDESLVANVLDAIVKLFEIDEIYGLKDEQSIIYNFCDKNGIEALDATILRYSALDLEGNDSDNIFVKANELHRVATDFKAKVEKEPE